VEDDVVDADGAPGVVGDEGLEDELPVDLVLDDEAQLDPVRSRVLHVQLQRVHIAVECSRKVQKLIRGNFKPLYTVVCTLYKH
jgi:hypothetical protein